MIRRAEVIDSNLRGALSGYLLALNHQPFRIAIYHERLKSTIAWSNRQYIDEMLFDCDIDDGRDETVVERSATGPVRLHMHVKEERKRRGVAVK